MEDLIKIIEREKEASNKRILKQSSGEITALATAMVAKSVELFGKQLNHAEDAETTLSDKGKAAQELVNSGDFGCNSKAVAKLVSVLTGEDIRYTKTADRLLPSNKRNHWRDGFVACPLVQTKRSEEDYNNGPIGSATMVYAGDKTHGALVGVQSGLVGDWFTSDKTVLRIPTVTEAESLLIDVVAAGIPGKWKDIFELYKE